MSKINQVDLTLEETLLGSFVNVFIIDYLFLIHLWQCEIL